MLKIFFAFGILWVYEWFILQQGISWALQRPVFGRGKSTKPSQRGTWHGTLKL
jgi:hypothetical protein